MLFFSLPNISKIGPGSLLRSVVIFKQKHYCGILVSLPGCQVVILGNDTTSSECWVSKPKAVCLST